MQLLQQNLKTHKCHDEPNKITPPNKTNLMFLLSKPIEKLDVINNPPPPTLFAVLDSNLKIAPLTYQLT
jgi:hypothetical protein